MAKNPVLFKGIQLQGHFNDIIRKISGCFHFTDNTLDFNVQTLGEELLYSRFLLKFPYLALRLHFYKFSGINID